MDEQSRGFDPPAWMWHRPVWFPICQLIVAVFFGERGGCPNLQTSNGRKMRFFKKLATTSAVYVGTCCLISASLYVLALETGNFEFRDQTGTVVQNVVVAPKTAFISSLFAGLFAGVFCSGGLLGLWYLVATSKRTDS